MSDPQIRSDLVETYDSDDDRQPHRQPDVLRCALVTHVLKPSETADILSEVFDYEVSPSAVRSAKDYHDIRDPFFPELQRRDGDGTEPGQPHSFLLDRSDDTPIHPADTDAHSHLFVDEANPPKGSTAANAEPSTTRKTDTPAKTQPTDTPDNADDSSPRRQTPLLKRLSDLVPSDWRIDPKSHRRDASLVAPPFAVEGDHFPERYHACGCGRCDKRHYLDGDDGGAIDCPRPVPVTVAGARRIYEVTRGTGYAQNAANNEVGRGRKEYCVTMKADSAALNDATEITAVNDQNDVTTVLLSLRLTSTDPHGRLITPWRLVGDCKDAWTEARDFIPTDAGDGRIAAFWTFAGTDHWATPHVHWYGWFHDPEDTVTRGDFVRAVKRFVAAAAFPAEGSHFDVTVDTNGPLFGGGTDAGAGSPDCGNDADATDDADELDADDLADGPVRVQHEPLLVNEEAFRTRMPLNHNEELFADLSAAATVPRRLKEGTAVQSRGAVYVASQLPKLALYGAESDAETEAAAFFDCHSDGRNTYYGQGAFYDLADITDEMVDQGHIV